MSKYLTICFVLLFALPQFCMAANDSSQQRTLLPKAQITTPETSNGLLDITQVIKKVQTAGYSSIYEVKFDDGRYKVKALNSKGKKVELHVNAATGSIKVDNDWF